MAVTVLPSLQLPSAVLGTPVRKPKQWSVVATDRKDRLSSKDWSTTAQELQRKLEDNPRYRLTVEWTLEEEPQ